MIGDRMDGMDATGARSALPVRPRVLEGARRFYNETIADEWGARRAYRGRIAALIFVVFLFKPVYSTITSDRPVAQIFFILAGLAAFGACFLAVIWRNTPLVHSNQAPWLTLFGIAVGTALLPYMGDGWLAFLSLYAVSMLIFNFGRRYWRYFVIGAPLVDVIVSYGVQHNSMSTALGVAAQTFLIALIQAAFFSQIRAKVELRQARADLARMAVIEERLRISRDLHDILGQRLSALSLKAEVAARLTGRDPDRAAREMGEVADIARAALADVRDTVSGYRSVSLESEVETARALLTAADVAFASTLAPLPPEIDECAGWLVREAVTNVIRHAAARNCAVKVIGTPSLATVEVSDDGGIELARRGREQDPLMDVVYGNGLTGLSERVNALGGTLTTRRGAGWFTVRAAFHLPVPA
jgi:two-component system, NarL family, sensor histidine kinase DesK